MTLCPAGRGVSILVRGVRSSQEPISRCGPGRWKSGVSPPRESASVDGVSPFTMSHTPEQSAGHTHTPRQRDTHTRSTSTGYCLTCLPIYRNGYFIRLPPWGEERGPTPRQPGQLQPRSRGRGLAGRPGGRAGGGGPYLPSNGWHCSTY